MPGTGTQGGARAASAGLLRAAHPEPGVAVTGLAVALALFVGLSPGRVAILAVAVLSGQFLVGWTNDLLDARLDGRVGRDDKPLASGVLRTRSVVAAAVVAAVVCVVFSLLCGPAAAAVHLVAGVGAALAYNVGLKATVVSWVPYLIAFGSLPVAVGLTARPVELPAVWVVIVAGILGVGAHLLNVYPDLDVDAANGVNGFPQRLGRSGLPVVAASLLTVATIIAVVGAGMRPWHWVALAGVVAVATQCRRAPLVVTVAIAAVDLVVIVTA